LLDGRLSLPNRRSKNGPDSKLEVLSRGKTGVIGKLEASYCSWARAHRDGAPGPEVRRACVLDQGSKSLAPLVGRFRKLWPDRKTLTRAPKVGADGAASRYFWEWRSGQKRKLGRLSDSSLTNDRPLVDAFVAARPIFPTGPGRTFHSTR